MGLRTRYQQLLQKCKRVLAYAKKAQIVNHRLYTNNLKLRQYYNRILKRTADDTKRLIENRIKEKYPLILDHQKRVLHIANALLQDMEMTRDEFSSSFYIDLLFEKYLPIDFTSTDEIAIDEFHFPILLQDISAFQTDYLHLHPFRHLGISGKRVYNKRKKLFYYFLSIRDISPEIELSYYEKTDLIIETLTAVNMQLLQAQKTIEAHKSLLISLVCSLVEEHNKETAQHLQNLRIITTHMTEEIHRLNLIKQAPYDKFQYLKDIAYTSVLHDIGKVHVKKDIIEKNTELIAEEFKEMQSHTIAGAAYIKKVIILFNRDPGYSKYIDFLMIPYQICLYHHEHWDGTGYPKGLKGPQIPLPARIVAIADAYDAMRSMRSYNIPCTHQEAVAEIRRCSGTHFDPNLVRVFLNIERKLEAIPYT
ncbi:MAG: HD domain-containing protein [Treponema sp.]|nr:HD domain-containing protein [Treponema sp.]